MSPWKLGSADDPTVRLELRLPKSLKDWLDAQPRGASATVRTMVLRAMRAQARRGSRTDLVT